MENYGKRFKKFRNLKQFSLNDLSEKYHHEQDKNVTRSTINKFENTNSNIGFLTIITALDKMNSDLSEFLQYTEIDYLSYHDDFEVIEKNGKVQNVKALYYQAEKYMENKNVRPRYELLGLLCIANAKRIEGESVDTEVSLLEEYLLGLDEWMRFEVSLFNNGMYLFHIDRLKSLLKRVKKWIDNYVDFNRFRDNHARIFLNATSLYLENENFTLAQEQLDYIEPYIIKSRFGLEKLTHRFMSGVVQYKIGNKSEGINSMEKSIELMFAMDWKSYAEGYQKVLDYYVETS